MTEIPPDPPSQPHIPAAPSPRALGLGLFTELLPEDEQLTFELWRKLRGVLTVASAAADDSAPSPSTREPPVGLATLDVALRCITDPACGDQTLAAAFVTLSAWAEERAYLETSAACAESAAYLDPGDPSAAILAGRLRRRLADYDRAEAWYIRGTALARELRQWEPYIQALLWHGFLHFQKAEYAEAERKYRSAGRAAKRYGRRALAGVAHHNLLTLASDLGSYEDGERHARRALSLYPVHFPRVPHLIHDYAFLLSRNGYFSSALRLLDHVEPLISAPQERVVVIGNIARAAGGSRNGSRFQAAADEIIHLSELSDENASRGFLGAADGAYCLGEITRAVDFATMAIEVALRRSDNEVERLARALIERSDRRDPPPDDRVEPEGFVVFAGECADRLRRWTSRPRGQAANMLRKHGPKQRPTSETAASTGWRRPAE